MRTTAALAAFVALAAAGAAYAKPSPRIVERSPAEITTAFRNPDMGWLTYVFRPVARPNSAFPGGPREARITPLSSTVYTNYFTWADLEPVEGYYRWDLIDRFLQAWPGRAVRLGIASSGRRSSFGIDPVPAWAKSQIDGGYYTHGNYWEPRYTSGVFQAKWGAFLRAFAHRYDDTPPGGVNWRDRIVSVDINSFGIYGEWWSKFDFGDRDVALSSFVDSHTETAPIKVSFDDVVVSRPGGARVGSDSFPRMNGSSGSLTAGPGTGGRIVFATVSERDVDIATSIGIARRPVNGSIVIDLIARSGPSGSTRSEYLGRVGIGSSGAFWLEVRKRVRGTESPIGSARTVPGLSLDPAARYRVRFDVAGANPTRLELKLWRVGTAEPADWMLTVIDDAPALQTAPVTSNLRYQTLKTLVDQYFDAFSGAYRPELTMNVIGSSVTGVRLDQADPSAVLYALARGATMVRRSIGARLGTDETKAITSRLDTRSFQGEWVSPDGVVAWLHSLDPNAPWVPTWKAIDQALSLGANYLGWYVDAQTVRCDRIPKDLPIAELPEMTQCGVNGTTSVTTHPLAKLYPGTHETLEDYFQRRAGYRFYVSRFAYPSSVAAGRRFALDQTWWQRGVGKLHGRYYVRARLSGRATFPLNVDTGLDANRWPAGPSGPHAVTSRFVVPTGTALGRYTLEFAVVDAGGSPAINLADSGKDTTGLADPQNDYGWYRVGPITITR